MKKLQPLILCSLLLFYGCKDERFHQLYRPIDSKVRISLWENLSTFQRALSFRCSTEKIYGCMNYSILYKLTKYGYAINIMFTEIYAPDICLTALGPATANVDLGSLADGAYNLSIIVNDQMFQTQFQVTTDAYRLTNSDGGLITFPRPVLMRVPDHTIWGSVGYHTVSSMHRAESFCDSLISRGAQPRQYIPGDYGYFEIDSTGAIKPLTNHGYYFIHPYVYYFPYDTLLVRNLVKEFGKTVGDSLSISLYGSHGEEFYSWVLRQEPGI